MNILVVDDEKLIRELIRRRLSKLGHEVRTVDSGHAAEEELRNPPAIDVVITDICMPDMDGIELLRQVKKFNRSVLVILMTGFAQVDSAADAVNEDAFAYLRKPFRIEELMAIVKRAESHITMHKEQVRYRQELEGLVRKLEISEQRYRTLIEGISGAVLWTDRDLVIQSASDRCTDVLGCSPGDLVGKSMMELRAQEEAVDFRARLEPLLKTGTGVVRMNGRLVRGDGSTLHTVEIAAPVAELAAPGDPTGIFWIIEDGSCEHQLRVEAEFAREYLEAMRRSRTEKRKIVGNSQAIREVLQTIQSVADSAASVLVCGGSGVGKELVAESIHINSGRADKPFVVVNCTTLQENLLESELFGHRRGAFTGAALDKRGLVEIADGGTLFVDEVAEMSPQLQGKMLRVLEQGQFRRLGCTDDRTTNIRVVAATNRELAKEVKAGRFREDLLYRLDVIRIEVPPLRDRKDDIPLIVEHLLKHSGASAGKPKRLRPETIEALMAYDWPGNVRELSNVIERAVILSGQSEEVELKHLSLDLGGMTKAVRPLGELANAEIDKALALVDGNKTRAAKMLGISRQTLISRMKRRKDDDGRTLRTDDGLSPDL